MSAIRTVIEGGSRVEGPVISLYMDLDPSEFATPDARQSQIISLIDGGHRDLEARERLGHEARARLRADLDWLRDWLLSDEPPFQGARALAVFRAGDAFTEVFPLSHPVQPQVFIGFGPHFAPLIAAGDTDERWAVALVSRAEAWILTGVPERLAEREHRQDDVHRQFSAGGWSEARYERSVEKDVDEHLRAAAEELHRRWRLERFERVVLGGPQETVPRFEAMLHDELKRRVLPQRLSIDLSSATQSDVQAAVAELAVAHEQRRVSELLRRLAESLGAGGRATGGLEATLAALNERRVETLLLAPDFAARGARCPTCGVITGVTEKLCPADGTEMEILREDGALRDAIVTAAIGQNADVVSVGDRPELGPHHGIAALLRF
jgi:hypothetical protein